MTVETTGPFTSLAQRIAFLYARSIASPEPGEEDPVDAAHLRGFFIKWYEAMAAAPEAFGLPVGEDVSTDLDQPDDPEKKSEVGAKVKKVRDGIGHGLGLLYLAGLKGCPRGDALVVDRADYAAFMEKQPRVKKKMLEGMALAGLKVAEPPPEVLVRNERYPEMMPALIRLAQGCSRQPAEPDALLHFSRCDLRAHNPEYCPDPADLYRVFHRDDHLRIMELHRYLLSMGYKARFQNNSPHGWEVQYQGDRKIKSSPFLHVEYSARLKNLLELRLKCASSSRVVPLVEKQGQALQDDFFRRTHRCRGTDCGWCKSRKSLGPTALIYQGQRHVICWYTKPDTFLRDEDALELVKEYAEMHERLAQGKSCR